MSRGPQQELLKASLANKIRRCVLIITVCPHAAFENPTTPLNSRLRESIECLVYVIFPQNEMELDEDTQVAKDLYIAIDQG